MRDAILVTGAAGFIGSHVALYLHECGRRVIALDNLATSPGWPDLPEAIPRVTCDVARVEAVIKAYKISAIIHCAGLISVGESVGAPGAYLRENAVKVIGLCEVAAAHGVAILLSSSAAVYRSSAEPLLETSPLQPISPYGASKVVAELALESYCHVGLSGASLRYFNVAGADPSGRLRECHDPETHLVPRAIDAVIGRAAPLDVYGDGSCARDYVHVWDLARAHARALDVLGAGFVLGAVNLGSGQGTTVLEVIAAVERVTGKIVPRRHLPPRVGDPPSLVADVARAREVLLWQPERYLDAMIEDALRSRLGT